jgi:C4-dicarboxylate transporter/malic acid transport protein
MSTQHIVVKQKSFGTSPESDLPAMSGVLRWFHPGWFGAVMGTAIVGITLFANPGKLASLRVASQDVGAALVLLAGALAVALGIPYVLRWARHPDAVIQDLRHPIVGPLFGTFPGGLLVLAVAVATVGPRYFSPATVHGIVAGLAWAGVPLAVAISVVFATLLFLAPNVEAPSANGGWFIPPVVNIIVPVVLANLVPHVAPATGRLLLVLGYATWGMGFVLFLLVASLLFHRLVFHPLPPVDLAPSLWISLGPLGVGGLALLRLAQVGAPLFGPAAGTVQAVSLIGALVLWGFGFWWLLVAFTLLARYLQMGRWPFGVGLWAFTFPLGAYTALTTAIARALNLSVLEWTGAALFIALAVLWVAVSLRTLAAVVTRKAWSR